MLTLALLTNDDHLTKTVRGEAGSEWKVVKSALDQLSSLIREPNVKLVVFDDQSVPDSDRGWALTEIRRCASRASIIYVAGEHDHENEKQARARGVLFYTAKPLLPGFVHLILERQLQMQNGKRDLAPR
jgi:DNA-binding NtrC family response regulator